MHRAWLASAQRVDRGFTLVSAGDRFGAVRGEFAGLDEAFGVERGHATGAGAGAPIAT